MSSWIYNAYMHAVMKELKIAMERRGVRFQGEGGEWRLPGLLYADDLVLCGESKEDPMSMLVRFVEVCRMRDLKVNAGKSKSMVLSGGKGLEFEVCVDVMRLKHVSEFK